MEIIKGRRRARAALVAMTAFAAVGLAACVDNPPAQNPGTPWLAAGCIDSSVPGVPDFLFNGFANVANNATAFQLTEEGAFSEDGTCTPGIATMSGTIIRAADSAEAIEVCDSLGSPVTDPARLVDYGYAAPIDAWTCLDNQTP
jgi:hypothetical protein